MPIPSIREPKKNEKLIIANESRTIGMYRSVLLMIIFIISFILNAAIKSPVLAKLIVTIGNQKIIIKNKTNVNAPVSPIILSRKTERKMTGRIYEK